MEIVLNEKESTNTVSPNNFQRSVLFVLLDTHYKLKKHMRQLISCKLKKMVADTLIGKLQETVDILIKK